MHDRERGRRSNDKHRKKHEQRKGASAGSLDAVSPGIGEQQDCPERTGIGPRLERH
jgi:hypothetical protein